MSPAGRQRVRAPRDASHIHTCMDTLTHKRTHTACLTHAQALIGYTLSGDPACAERIRRHTQSRGLRRDDAHQICGERESPHSCKNHQHKPWSAHHNSSCTVKSRSISFEERFLPRQVTSRRKKREKQTPTAPSTVRVLRLCVRGETQRETYNRRKYAERAAQHKPLGVSLADCQCC
jgi:hypothetical protein